MENVNITSRNISLNGEPISLIIGATYYVIDALYADEIKSDGINIVNFEMDIREQFFEHCEYPFTKFKAQRSTFSPKDIKSGDYPSTHIPDNHFFGSDSGAILIIREDVFLAVVNQFSYDLLFGATGNLINQSYWDSLEILYDPHAIALVIAPGNSDYEFNGSGFYQIV